MLFQSSHTTSCLLSHISHMNEPFTVNIIDDLCARFESRWEVRHEDRQLRWMSEVL